MYFLNFIREFFLILLSTSLVYGRAGEVCFPFGGQTDGQQQEVVQGRPGKVGPHGPAGPQGIAGPPGICACDPSEIEDLRAQIRVLTERVARREHEHTDKVGVCSVGLKDRRIADDDITASSTYSSQYLPKYARLDIAATSGNHGSWLGCNTCRSPGEWIQVDLKSPTRLTGIVTQGIASAYSEWVTTYKVGYGNAPNNVSIIQDAAGEDLIFQGNRDSHTAVTNMFPYPILARYVRVIVQTWNNWGALRMEFLTC